MAKQDLKYAKDKDLVASFTAMKRAAEMARQLAIQTGTSIVIMKDQQIVHVTAEQLRQEHQV
ncbi:MAG: hypothetical protein RLZ92_579 [Pseudomonadota bacterium]